MTVPNNSNNRRSHNNHPAPTTAPTPVDIPIVYAAAPPDDDTSHSADTVDPYVVQVKAYDETTASLRQQYAAYASHGNPTTSTSPLFVSASQVHGVETTAATDNNNEQAVVVTARPVRPGNNSRTPTAVARPVLPPAVQAYKNRRKRRQSVALVAGGVVGGVFLGPAGAVLTAIVAHQITKKAGRAQQHRLARRVQQQQAQAQSASVAQAQVPL